MIRLRRVLALNAVVIASSLLAPAPATAWSNGVDGPDSYGTHDWILDKALDAAGEDASWVRVRVALKATDDPDTEDGVDHASGTWWHVYDASLIIFDAKGCNRKIHRITERQLNRAANALPDLLR